MKRLGGIFILLLAIFAAAFLILPSNRADAAACSNVSSFGAVSLNVPKLPSNGEVRVWVRVQSPNPSSSVLLEINDIECLEIEGTNLSNSVWSWHPYSDINNPKTVKFNSAEGNTVKIIGIDSGVRIDKVLFTSKDCTPQEFGDNCIGAAEARQVDLNSIQQIPPPTSESVSGSVQLTTTPRDFLSTLEKVEYVVNGKVVQSSTKPVPFETDRVTNGKHTVLIETSLTNGKVIRESTILKIKNPINPFSPIIRWAKINYNSFKIAAISIGLLVVTVISFLLVRSAYKKHRERKFHGF